MSEAYILTFATSTGKTKTVRITNPNTSLNDSVIQAAITNIKNSNIFDKTDGPISAFKKVELEEVTRKKVI